MPSNTSLSIYVAEQLLSDSRYEEQIDWYHAYLILAKEVGRQSIPQQELHFGFKKGGIMSPTAKKPESKSSHTHLCVIENASITLAYWNHALQFAKHVKEHDIPFGNNFGSSPTAINCRTGVKDTLAVLGIELKDTFFKSSAGTETSLDLNYPQYSANSTPIVQPT